ncbi:hypothetical protein SUT380_09680 [Streptococcus parasuis]|nr:hypothetical protein SUT380_09680 [Streptococcus parasuis]
MKKLSKSMLKSLYKTYEIDYESLKNDTKIVLELKLIVLLKAL